MANEPAKTERPVFESMAISAEAAFKRVASEKIWLKEIGFALQILRGNAESFMKCDPASIRDAVINIALTGATLNPAMQQAYLIPRSLKGKLKCCLDFGYRGLVDIAVNSGSVLDIDATCVYANDKFFYQQGLNPVLDHVPTMESKRGELIGVYAIAVLHHGIKKFIYLSKDDVEQARKSSAAPNSPAWQGWYGEMARKTAVKRIYKLLPQTERMSVAVAAVNEHEGLAEKNNNKAVEVMKRFSVEPDVNEHENVLNMRDFEAELKTAADIAELEAVWADFEATKPGNLIKNTMKTAHDARVAELKKG